MNDDSCVDEIGFVCVDTYGLIPHSFIPEVGRYESVCLAEDTNEISEEENTSTITA